jgi:16S rRNA (cytosine1402-N4)-methyltransferase
MIYHTPVLLPQVLDGLQIHPGQWYIDATVGGGGYAVEILKRGGKVLGVDIDEEAIEFTRGRITQELPGNVEGKDWKLICDNFRNIITITRSVGLDHVAGALFDLGVSSHQIDTGRRGMSFRFPDEPFDLRLSQKQGETAASLVNRLSREELYEIIARYGEEERAIAIVDGFLGARNLKPLSTVGDVVAVITHVTGTNNSEGVLARVFQAFRIAANDELHALREGLAGADKMLMQNGRLVVVSFHSLEDRIVKQFFRNGSWQIVTKDIARAGEAERLANRRSRSAKLRIGEKL